MRRLLKVLVGVGLLIVPAHAHAQFTLGAAAAWHDDFDLGIGAYGFTPLTALHENATIGGDFVYFFPDESTFGTDFSYFEINANVGLSFPIEAAVTPFVIGGINIARFSVDTGISIPGFSFDASSTEVGLNLGGGIGFGSEDSAFSPVVGAKIELSGGEGFVLFGGIGFPVGD